MEEKKGVWESGEKVYRTLGEWGRGREVENKTTTPDAWEERRIDRNRGGE